MRYLSVVFLFLFSHFLYGQELNCQIIVDAKQVNQTNLQIFKKLEKSLQEFVNKSVWTSRYLPFERRINCSMVFSITNYDGENFVADFQVQSSRPVYGSLYQTNILNYREKSVKFSYLENAPLFFDKSKFDSELTSLIAYYIYLIIGIDANTFEKNRGREAFETAQSIVLNAQIEQGEAWQEKGEKNRWQLVSDLLSMEYEVFNEVLYSYHKGLDLMESEPNQAKEKIKNSLLKLEKLQNGRLNQFLIQLFFDAKSDEIFDIFSAGKEVSEARKLKQVLNKLAPLGHSKWEKIR